MIVFALNIHTGGGKVLLDALIRTEPFGSISYLFLDTRYQIQDIPSHIKVRIYSPSLVGRIKAQVDLKNLVEGSSKDEPILFFGNWPPFFKINTKSIIYLQNCFLLSGVPIYAQNTVLHLKILFERYLLKIFKKNFDEIWVQSEWMASLSQRNFPQKIVVKRPFMPELPAADIIPSKVYDFITVTSLAPYKNFDVFIGAVSILDNTLNRAIKIMAVLDTPGDLNRIKIPDLKNIDFQVVSNISRNELFELYQISRAAVVSSSYESFCLPLHEAIGFNLDVVAVEAPYTINVPSIAMLYKNNSPDCLASALKEYLDKMTV